MNARTDLYASIFSNALQAIILIDRHGIIEDTNPAVQTIFGYRREELTGRNVSILMPAPYRDAHDAYIARHLKSGEAGLLGVRRELEAVRKDGSLFPVEVAVSEVRVKGETYFIGMVEDITERKENEYLLSLNNRVMRAINQALGGFVNANVPKRDIFDSILERLLDITDSEYGFIGEIFRTQDKQPYLLTHAITNIAWNQETRRFYKENVRKGLEFTNLDTLFGITIRSGEVVISNDPANDPRSGGLPKGHPSLDAYLGLPIHHGGRLIGMAGVSNRPGGYDEELADLLKPLLGTMGSLINGYNDQHSRKKAEQNLYRAQAKLRQLATQDSLTGIPNRKSLYEQLEDAFRRSADMDDEFSLLFIDIDRFKNINDELGHLAGDEAIRQTVAIIQHHMRPSDIFGRYGGEEFVLGLLDCDAENAAHCAERFRMAVENSEVVVGDQKQPLHLTVSIGVATMSDATKKLEALMHQADEAMYAAKNAGRNCVRAWSGKSERTGND